MAAVDEGNDPSVSAAHSHVATGVGGNSIARFRRLKYPILCAASRRRSRGAYSLLPAKFSLIPFQKFPVQLSREFCCKPLNSLIDWIRKSPVEPGFCKIPCQFPCYQGIGDWRRVRVRLHPQPCSRSRDEVVRDAANSRPIRSTYRLLTAA
jgi:hypothetical protein